jgi:hypothetical protein
VHAGLPTEDHSRGSRRGTSEVPVDQALARQ